MFANAPPVLICHWTLDVGLPAAAAVSVTALPTATV